MAVWSCNYFSSSPPPLVCTLTWLHLTSLPASLPALYSQALLIANNPFVKVQHIRRHPCRL